MNKILELTNEIIEVLDNSELNSLEKNSAIQMAEKYNNCALTLGYLNPFNPFEKNSTSPESKPDSQESGKA